MASNSPVPHKPDGKGIDDTVLGSVGRLIPKSDAVDRLSVFLSSYSGSDKLFMVIEYTLKLLVPFLNWRARVRYSRGKGAQSTSNLASSFSKLAGLISDSRMLWRLFGLVPIIQWLSAIERSPARNKRILTIERLQALSMLAYYPLEHLYYFGAHGIYTVSPQRLTSLSVWSIRAWAVYILLQFLHIKEDVAALETRGEALVKAMKETREKEEEHGDLTAVAMSDVEIKAERRAIRKERSKLLLGFIVNLAYFPQTIHWSLEKGYFKNEIWMTIFGFVSGIASFKGGWDATA